MSKRKLAEVLWIALVYAKQERASIIDAYDGDKTEEAVVSAISDIKAFNNLQIKLFGTNKTMMDVKQEKMKSISIYKLAEFVKENPELFDIHTDKPE